MIACGLFLLFLTKKQCPSLRGREASGAADDSVLELKAGHMQNETSINARAHKVPWQACSVKHQVSVYYY
jgi:hypothetical protein